MGRAIGGRIAQKETPQTLGLTHGSCHCHYQSGACPFCPRAKLECKVQNQDTPKYKAGTSNQKGWLAAQQGGDGGGISLEVEGLQGLCSKDQPW